MVFDFISIDGILLLIKTIDDLLITQLPFKFQINFTQLGGAVENYYNNCYFPKKAKFVITILNTWEDQELTNIGKLIPINFRKNLIKYTSNYCLPNIIDYDLDDYLTSYYGTNQDKLILIKNKYDPLNIFNWKQSIPLSK